MRSDRYEKMSPEDKARFDYREEGAGQDANPYDITSENHLHGLYAWEMSRIWREDFRAQIQLAKSETVEKAKRDGH